MGWNALIQFVSFFDRQLLDRGGAFFLLLQKGIGVGCGGVQSFFCDFQLGLKGFRLKHADDLSFSCRAKAAVNSF